VSNDSPDDEPVKPFSIHDLKDDEPRMCRCGYDRYHLMVTPELEYTIWGTFWVTVMGVSAVPQRARFRCRRCRERFDFTDDPQELKKFI
jgi:hypothetical protein